MMDDSRMGWVVALLSILAMVVVGVTYNAEINDLEAELAQLRDAPTQPSCEVTSTHNTPKGDLLIVWLCHGS